MVKLLQLFCRVFILVFAVTESIKIDKEIPESQSKTQQNIFMAHRVEEMFSIAVRSNCFIVYAGNLTNRIVKI